MSRLADIAAYFIVMFFIVVLTFVLPAMQYVWWQRRRFRLHLSTVVLATFLAGGVLGLNLSSAHRFGFYFLNYGGLFDESWYRGWPIQVLLPQHWKQYW